MMMATTSFGITKVCIGCGNTFVTESSQRLRCVKNCGRSSQSRNAARARSRAEGDRLLIGIDGEGVPRPTGEHIYDMLSVGSETLVSHDGGHLHYTQIFEFLYQ